MIAQSMAEIVLSSAGLRRGRPAPRLLDFRGALFEGRLRVIERIGYPRVRGRRRVGLRTPHPFHFAVSPLCANPADCGLIHDRDVIFVPDGGVQLLEVSIGARFAEQQSHALSQEQAGERNQEDRFDLAGRALHRQLSNSRQMGSTSPTNAVATGKRLHSSSKAARFINSVRRLNSAKSGWRLAPYPTSRRDHSDLV